MCLVASWVLSFVDLNEKECFLTLLFLFFVFVWCLLLYIS